MSRHDTHFKTTEVLGTDFCSKVFDWESAKEMKTGVYYHGKFFKHLSKSEVKDIYRTFADGYSAMAKYGKKQLALKKGGKRYGNTNSINNFEMLVPHIECHIVP